MTGAGVPNAVRARFSADPASVPGARWFVANEIRVWGRSDLVEDAELCVSELAANAALHSRSTFMEIALEALERGVRISVEDDGVEPLETVVPGYDFSDVDIDAEIDLEDSVGASLADEATHGRGLAIVSYLAADWGVDRTATGKRVWVELRETSG
jgi:anti-sigma regulatory factor (Ser/Thr protein kinase)